MLSASDRVPPIEACSAAVQVSSAGKCGQVHVIQINIFPPSPTIRSNLEYYKHINSFSIMNSCVGNFLNWATNNLWHISKQWGVCPLDPQMLKPMVAKVFKIQRYLVHMIYIYKNKLHYCSVDNYKHSDETLGQKIIKGV